MDSSEIYGNTRNFLRRYAVCKDAHSNNVIHRFPRLFAGDFLALYHVVLSRPQGSYSGLISRGN